jgi:nucleotide-binding universal stress UspA family protein
MRTVVVYALDHRPRPSSSLSRVAFFAWLYGAELRILRVIPRSGSRRSKKEESVPGLLGIGAAAVGSGGAVRVVERTGSIYRTIVDYVRSHHVAVLAIDALLGAHSVQRVGSIVSRLGRSAKCPLLVLPRPRRREASTSGELREILCALDHGRAAAATLRAARFIARQAQARLTLLHVLPPLSVRTMLSGMEAARLLRRSEALAAAQRKRLKRLVSATEARQLRVEYVVGTGEPDRAIARTSVDIGAQLIVMGVVPRDFVDRVLIGSTSGPVLRSARIPVLLVPPRSAGSTTKSRSAHRGPSR